MTATLLDDHFAPTTSRIGFLNCDLRATVTAQTGWLATLYENVEATAVLGELPTILGNLGTLSAVTSRMVWCTVGADWTAYFDNGLNGSDPESALHVLCQRLGCRMVTVTSSPSVTATKGPVRNGAVEFTVSGEGGFKWAEGRSVMVSQDNGRWKFDMFGAPFEFEEVASYTARRVRDRFTSMMLQRYCRALGIDVFNKNAYGPEASLIEFSAYIDKWTPQVLKEYGQPFEFPPSPPRPKPLEMDLAAAQKRLGIVPGLASKLPD